MAGTLSVSQEELDSIIAEVSSDLEAIFKSEKESLMKAQDPTAEDEAPPAEDGSEASASPPPAEDEGSASAPPAGGPEDSASADAAPPADGAAPPDGQDPAQEQGSMDVNALTAEYAQLPPEELKMHYMAAKAALYQVMGGGADGGAAPAGPDAAAGAGAPPAGPEGSAGAPPPAPAMKGEMSAGKVIESSPANGGKMAKSETDTRVETLSNQVEVLAKALDFLVGQPTRKAVTSLNYLAKSGEVGQPDARPLTKAEIKTKLSEKARDPSLSKSDRKLITQFCLDHVDASQIEHLLK